jgi:hypothetical protein
MKQFKTKLTLFLFFLFNGWNANTAYCQESVFSFEKYINDKGDTLNYRQLFRDYDTEVAATVEIIEGKIV